MHCCQGQRSPLLGFTITDIATKLHEFVIYSCGVFVHTDSQMDPTKTVRCCVGLLAHMVIIKSGSGYSVSSECGGLQLKQQLHM